MIKLSVYILMLILLLFVPIGLVSAEVSVKEKPISPVIIAELGNPGVFDFEFSNTGDDDNVQIYTTIGVDLIPRSGIDLPKGTSTVQVRAYPSEKLKSVTGNYLIEYFIKGGFGVKRETFELNVVRLEDAIVVIPNELRLNDKELDVRVKNIRASDIGKVKAKFTSPFFDVVREFELGANDEVVISIPIEEVQILGISAGSYIVGADLEVEGNLASVNGVLNYVESQETSFSSSLTGFLIRTSKVTKVNEGNVPVVETITIDKGAISRLFTSYSIEPDRIERNGLNVNYQWDRQLQPGEVWEVKASTNYTMPFVLLLVVVIIGFLVYTYTTTNVIVSKRVTHVRTKGGEFALKVHLSVKSRKNVEKIQLVDRIPGMTKLYEKASRVDRIENDGKKLVWDLEGIRAGEERVFSYVIYSKINVVGKFELPVANASYDIGEERKHVVSNRAIFLAESSRDD
jgi:hypothetical protein